MAKDTKERILTAALDLFSQKGYFDTSFVYHNGKSEEANSARRSWQHHINELNISVSIHKLYE